MKVAIVHDYLTVFGGAERVLEQLLLLYPQAELFSLLDFLPEERRHHLLGKKAKTTFMQRLPFIKTHYRYYLPLMPLAIEQIDLSGFALIISISYAVAKGIIVAPGQTHICICCSPMRYIWDLRHQYLAKRGFFSKIKWVPQCYFSHKLRLWDALSSSRVDHFIAVSHFIRERIRKSYRREATVIYPPVAVEQLPFTEKKEAFYLTASRLVCYKKVELIIDAFASMPDKKLIVIGAGPEYKRLKKRKKNNVVLLGYQTDKVLHDYMKRAQAFIFAAEEDFGIVPLEAMACGTPVIAYGRGGVRETVLGLEHSAPTGLFFEEQTVTSLQNAICMFEKSKASIMPASCRAHAKRFSNERFREEIKMFIEGLNI